jgi:O-acetylhomoserine (thiol)-lyase
MQGIETLPLRMKKHIENTHEMLDFLQSHEQVEWVKHPDLETHPDHKIAKKILPKGSGSIIVFGIKGGREAGQVFIESVQLASHLANVGDAKTLLIHPGSTTHSHLSDEAMKEGGLTDDMIRLSVGLEDINDIKKDFEKGFKAVKKLSDK